ncbi:PQQ-binding-like beta-propeller repeat protein [Natronosalvus vescus]|uniref:PQQ-binding-like beta-propeller repeat protein n=1 Tax=Natronosalvus vescus TaxID=2953881 RepID=UPI002091CAD6|nr:PQQ-binding-like beta-propeller repeat protein [Natronosalvus vescus]
MTNTTRRHVLKYTGLTVAVGGILSTRPATADSGSNGASAVGWSSIRGNAGNTAYVPDESGPDASAAVAWEYDHGGPVAVVDGIVFLTVDGAIHALDADSGELLGETNDIGAGGTPAVVDGTLYVGGDRLTAIDIGNDEVGWEIDLEPDDAVPSPTVVEGTVFVVADGTLYAIEADDGDEAWTFEPDDGSLIEQPVAAGDGAVFTTDGETLYATEIDDGSERWTNDHGEYRAQLIVATNRAVSTQAGGDDLVAVYETDTGELNWGKSGSAVGLATSEHVYMAAEDGIVGYHHETGEEHWRSTIEDATFGMPVGAGPTVYVGIDDSSEGTGVAAFDVVEDDLEWVVETESRPTDLAFADGTVFASDDGLLAIRSGGGENGVDDPDEDDGEANESDDGDDAESVDDENGADDDDETDDGETETDEGDGESDEDDDVVFGTELDDGTDEQDDGMPGFTTGAGVVSGALTLEWLRRRADGLDDPVE